MAEMKKAKRIVNVSGEKKEELLQWRKGGSFSE